MVRNSVVLFLMVAGIALVGCSDDKSVNENTAWYSGDLPDYMSGIWEGYHYWGPACDLDTSGGGITWRKPITDTLCPQNSESKVHEYNNLDFYHVHFGSEPVIDSCIGFVNEDSIDVSCYGCF